MKMGAEHNKKIRVQINDTQYVRGIKAIQLPCACVCVYAVAMRKSVCVNPLINARLF